MKAQLVTPAGGSATLTSYVWCGSSICQARDAGNSPTRGYYVEGEFAPGSPASAAPTASSMYNDAYRQEVNGTMYPDIDWAREPSLDELRAAHALLTTNVDLARSKLEVLADRGSVASMWYLGDAYSSGRYFAKNLEIAKMWYLRAEASDWTPASYRLGRTYFALKDYGSAYEAFSRGTAKGYVPAVYRLGMMYKEGLGAMKDLNECRRLLNIAASEGHLFAKRDLAQLFMSGSFGVYNIPKGIWMMISLISELIAITIRREWKHSAFEDRTLA